MKKILFVGDAESIHLKKWVDYFDGKPEYEVFLATFSQKNKTSANNVYYLSRHKVKNSGCNYQYLFFVNKISDIIKKIQPDYINAHFSYSMGFLALLSLKISGVKAELSVVCHGSDILDVPALICKYINKLVLKNANKIVAVSGQIADRIFQWGIEEYKIFVGQYGVELSKLENNERDIDIISIRNYVENSRIDELLSALSVKAMFGKKIVFVMPQIKENQLMNLKKIYPQIDMYNAISHDMILNLLKRSKIYISATKSDGSSLSLMEAMALGAIPLVSNIPANREWIVDQMNGFMFYRIEDIVRKIENIYDLDESQRKTLCLNNYKLMSNRGCYKEQMGKLEQFLFR